MDAATRFTRGDIVRAAYTTQGLRAQRKYIVDEVVVEPTPFGGFTTYYLLDAKRTGKRFRVANGHLVLSKVEPQQLTIRITNLVLFALSLDDRAMQQSIDVEVIYGKSLNDVVGGVEEIATVLHDIHSRAWNDKDSGWDQPKNWEVRLSPGVEERCEAIAGARLRRPRCGRLSQAGPEGGLTPCRSISPA